MAKLDIERRIIIEVSQKEYTLISKSLCGTLEGEESCRSAEVLARALAKQNRTRTSTELDVAKGAFDRILEETDG